MRELEDINTVIYKTIHKNKSKKSIEQIADEMGIDVMTLYKYPLPEPSGSNMPLKRLIPLMKATGDYSLLKHIAAMCEYIVVKVPRFKASKGDSNEIISSYQATSCKAFNDMIEFFKNRSKEIYQKVTESLRAVMEESVGTQKYIDKEFSGQLDAFEQD